MNLTKKLVAGISVESWGGDFDDPEVILQHANGSRRGFWLTPDEARRLSDAVLDAADMAERGEVAPRVSLEIKERCVAMFHSRVHAVSFDEVTSEEVTDMRPDLALSLLPKVRLRESMKNIYCFYFRAVAYVDPFVSRDGLHFQGSSSTRRTSGRYFFDGQVVTSDEILSAFDSESGSLISRRVLAANMSDPDRSVAFTRVRDGYRLLESFRPGDVLIDGSGRVVKRGDDGDLVEYRDLVRRRTEESSS